MVQTLVCQSVTALAGLTRFYFYRSI